MTQTRRYAIKQILFVAGGAMLIPSCMEDKSKASVILTNLKIDAGQEKLLAELAETIIPATTTPGAKDISAHLFALKMVDDCYKPEDQQKFVTGMEQFDKACKTQNGKSFVDCTMQQRALLLKDLETKKDQDNELAFFYKSTKQLTIQAYTTSKFYLTNVRVYEMVPGRFHGCVPITA
ncbi:MAG: gluconate 2-dehydrogenase subunit 3 family protein [Panacibacter sp.]